MDAFEKVHELVIEHIADRFVELFGENLDSQPFVVANCFDVVSMVTAEITLAEMDFIKAIEKQLKEEEQRKTQLETRKGANRKTPEGYIRVPIFVDGKGVLLEQLEENYPEVLKTADMETWEKLGKALEKMEILVDLDPKTGDYIPVKFKDNIEKNEVILR